MIIHADILEWARTYEGPLMHSVLTDPPYGLSENEVDITAVLADWMADREYRPRGAGFMGREWDSFIPGPAIWRAIRQRCYPGAYLFAFGGTRTADLLGLALRLAGWEKVDEIDWCYGSGFPKNHNIGKAIDRAAKADRPIVGTKKHQPKFDAQGFEYRKKDNGYNSKDRASFDLTIPATDLARIWDGYGTALKPAHEPILVFRNPFKGTYAANCIQHGAGGLWIDGGRVGSGGQRQWTRPRGMGFSGGTNNGPCEAVESEQGRWPANLILTHSHLCEQVGTRRVRGESAASRNRIAKSMTFVDGVGGMNPNAHNAPNGYADADGLETVADWRCVPSCAVFRLGVQSGEISYGGNRQGEITDSPARSWKNSSKAGIAHIDYSDTGTAARYFYQADYLLDRLEDADPIIYCAKSSRAEREAGLDPRTVALMRDFEEDAEAFDPITVDDGRQTPIDNAYLRGETQRRNPHPCLKPLTLTRYLATLLLPPVQYAPRRILIPFCGVASEYIGALLAGWEEIVGVELDSEGLYIPVANARVAYWQQRKWELSNPDRPITAKAAPTTPAGQLDMFDAPAQNAAARELRDERTHNIELLAELEGWKDEALEGRKRDDMA